MSNRIEAQPLEIVETSSLACNKTRHDEAHAGEPMGRLSMKDLDRYSTAMRQKSGLPPEDARRVLRTVRREYEQGDEATRSRLGKIMRSATEGLSGKRNQELIPVRQEITVFRG